MPKLIKAKDILNNLDLGTSIAEKDDGLDTYFVKTQIFPNFGRGKYDIVFWRQRLWQKRGKCVLDLADLKWH